MAEILVLYYSRGGSVARLARQVARGVGEVPGMVARV
ncbi:MAG: NAD(P)H-quinone oxidoreductase, partial [Lysobacter sp.]|nr:NAD(P)H-quinone oxidoreductase [Lysobacter sp.]